jgi:ADP-heptose:LPS heptosyltransferase
VDGAYALVIPGTSMSQGGAKKWPTDRFAGLAAGLAAMGLRPVIVGARAEAGDAARIRAACPGALDLTGQTSIQELAGLAARARLAVGGDTGPLHLAAMMGCPVVALFSRFSNPALAAPVGQARILAAARLDQVELDKVLAAVRELTSLAPGGAVP